MSDSTGKSRTLNRRRQKNTQPQRQRVLSRCKTLRMLAMLLAEPSPLPAEALLMLTRHHYTADELTEAGVSYEVVRAIERCYPFLLQPEG